MTSKWYSLSCDLCPLFNHRLPSGGLEPAGSPKPHPDTAHTTAFWSGEQLTKAKGLGRQKGFPGAEEASAALRKCSSNFSLLFSLLPLLLLEQAAPVRSGSGRAGGSSQPIRGEGTNDSLEPLSDSAGPPSFPQIEMKQCSANERAKDSGLGTEGRSQPRAGIWPASSDPCAVPQAQHVSAYFFFFFFFSILGEKRGQSAGSAGHCGDLEDPVVSLVEQLPPEGFSFTPHYMLDSWEHSPRWLWSPGLPARPPPPRRLPPHRGTQCPLHPANSQSAGGGGCTTSHTLVNKA